MKEKSIKNIRKEFKDKGIFYTPTALAERLKSYITNNPKTVYDPTCGSGNLLKVWSSDVKKFGQELDAEQLALIDDENFVGHAGDTLENDMFNDMKFDAIVANPPFSVNWCPENHEHDIRFKDLPCLAPKSKADWAFISHILYHLTENGIAAVLEFPGILYRGNRELKIRKWFVDNNFIDTIVEIPANTFEDTTISTVLLVLKKNKKTTNIRFERNDKSREVSIEEIKDNNYTLSPNTYITDEQEQEVIDIEQINNDVVDLTLSNLKKNVFSLIELHKVFGANEDVFHIKRLVSGIGELYHQALEELNDIFKE